MKSSDLRTVEGLLQKLASIEAGIRQLDGALRIARVVDGRSYDLEGARYVDLNPAIASILKADFKKQADMVRSKIQALGVIIDNGSAE